MAARSVQYYFGRLNLTPIYPYSEKLGLLRAVLRSRTPIVANKRVWQIFRVAEFNGEADLGLFLSGYLGRYKKVTKVEVASLEAQDVNSQTIENVVSAKSLFFLHVASGILAYHSTVGQIPPRVFRSRFAQLLYAKARMLSTKAPISLRYVEVDPINEEASLRDQLKEFDRIEEIRIVLHPSNPSNREVWKRVDERLRQLAATQYTETIKTKDPQRGLAIVDDEEVISKISMAEDGYGKASARGTIKGEEHTVTTSSNPVTAFAPSDPESPRSILGYLQAPFSKLFTRFKE